MLWNQETPFWGKFLFLPDMPGPTAAAEDTGEKVGKDRN